MQLLGTVLIVQALPVSQAGTYFAIIAAANFISAFSDFGFCQYSFRYVSRGVPLVRVYAGAVIVSFWGTLLSAAIGATAAPVMHLPGLLVVAAILGSAIHKLTGLNRYALVPQGLFARAMLIDGVQPSILVVLLIIYLGSHLTGGNGELKVACVIYLGSFIVAFPIGVAIGRTSSAWRDAIVLCWRRRSSGYQGVRRAVMRSVLLAIEWNFVALWMNFLVLWFQAAGYTYETAVAGILQRVLGLIRIGTAVSIQMRLTQYYTARASYAYLRALAKQAVQFGGAVAIASIAMLLTLKFSGAWITHLTIAVMCGEVARYPAHVGTICALEYLFFHLSTFALGLNLKSVRVLAPVIGLVFLTAAGAWSSWLPPSDRIGYGLSSYILSLSAGSALLVAFMLWCGERGLLKRHAERVQ
jgi:hypothetical protein